jgi:hypothetical protein
MKYAKTSKFFDVLGKKEQQEAIYGKFGISGQAQLRTKQSWTSQISSPSLDHSGESCNNLSDG